LDITVDRKAFHVALGVVSRAISTHSMPILAGVRFTAEGESLELAATNLDTSIATRIKATVRAPGVEAIPAKPLGECVAAAVSDELALRADDKHKVEIRADRCRSEIRGWTAADFPAVDLSTTGAPLALTAGALRDAIASVIFAAATGDKAAGRPTLGGVHVETRDGGLELVATDSFRLAWVRLPLAYPDPELADVSTILPRTALVEMARILGSVADDAPVTFGLGGSAGTAPSRAVFTVGDTALVTRLIEGGFPNWQQIVPTQIATTLSVDRAIFQRSVRSAEIFAETATGIVRLGIERNGEDGLGKLSVSAKGELGEAEDWLPCGIQGDGLKIALNGKYLAEALASIPTENVKLQLSTANRPAVFRPQGDESQLVVVMPMAVNDKEATQRPDRREEGAP
jgi:DNA polymerase-3 subunit beta